MYMGQIFVGNPQAVSLFKIATPLARFTAIHTQLCLRSTHGPKPLTAVDFSNAGKKKPPKLRIFSIVQNPKIICVRDISLQLLEVL